MYLLHRAATTVGAAASHRDQQMRTTNEWLESNGCEFVPVSVKSYGRSSQPAMKLSQSLGEEAAGPGGVSRASFVEEALWELSVGLVRGNHFLYRVCVGMLAWSGGACFRPGQRLMFVRNIGLAVVVLMMSGLDDAACYHIRRAGGLELDVWM
jgi:hypothetical protein